MEAFAIATGAIQVASFGAEVSSALYKCIRDIRHAPRDIEALKEEVDAVNSVLESVAGLLKSPNKTALPRTTRLFKDTKNVLDGCRKVFSELENAAKQASGGLASQSTWDRLTTKAKWPLSKGRVSEIQDILERHRGVLHMMLTALQFGEIRNAATSAELKDMESRLRELFNTRVGFVHGRARVNHAMDDFIQPPPMPEPLHGPSASRGDMNGPGVGDRPRGGSGLSPSGPHRPLRQQPSSTIPGLTGGAGVSNTAAMNSAVPPTLQSNVPADHLRPSTASAHASPSPSPSPRLQSSSGLMYSDLAECKAAVDQLANSLAATLAQLQGSAGAGSTDLNIALAGVLISARKLPAGLRCNTCECQIAWRHLGQHKGRCEDGRSCNTRGLSSRIMAAEYEVRYIDTEVVRARSRRYCEDGSPRTASADRIRRSPPGSPRTASADRMRRSPLPGSTYARRHEAIYGSGRHARASRQTVDRHSESRRRRSASDRTASRDDQQQRRSARRREMRGPILGVAGAGGLSGLFTSRARRRGNDLGEEVFISRGRHRETYAEDSSHEDSSDWEASYASEEAVWEPRRSSHRAGSGPQSAAAIPVIRISRSMEEQTAARDRTRSHSRAHSDGGIVPPAMPRTGDQSGDDSADDDAAAALLKRWLVF